MSKCFYLRRTHLLRMALSVKQDKAPRPIDISRLGANAVMARAQMITQTIQSLGAGAPGTSDAVGAARSEDDFIRKILGLPKRHHLVLSL